MAERLLLVWWVVGLIPPGRPIELFIVPASRSYNSVTMALSVDHKRFLSANWKAGTCARDRRALQQLALNVHVKHSDLT